MEKGKTLKHILCYFGLFVLVCLLFTPLVFKIVFKETDTPSKKKEDVVEKLVCDKSGERVNSSFVNGIPRNFLYTIVGNYVEGANPTENVNQTTTTENVKTETTIQDEPVNPVLKLLLNYGSLTYNDQDNTSSIQFAVDSISATKDYELIFNTIEHQEEYFRSQGFTCNKQTA